MYSCDACTPHALDVMLDEHEALPIMQQVDSEAKQCDFCERVAKYELLKGDATVEWA